MGATYLKIVSYKLILLDEGIKLKFAIIAEIITNNAGPPSLFLFYQPFIVLPSLKA